MESPQRGALTLVRFVAACFIVIGALEVGLYLTPCFNPRHPAPLKILPIAGNSIPALIGIVILAKAKAIAEWIADKIQ